MTRTSRRLLTPALGALVAATLLVGCGSSSESPSAPTAAPAGSIPTTPANAKGCRTLADAKAETKAPAVTVPAEDETSIVVTDDIPGCGALVKPTSSVTVHYVLKSKSSGQEVDNSWSRGEPFGVTLGQGGVISGWDKGIPGMRAGGRRTLVLGPKYGYGDGGSGTQIVPGDTLVFTIDALDVG